MENQQTGDVVCAYVYKTYDYDKFKKLDYNRTVVARRKELLMTSFMEGDILNPIVVNGRFEIIDGQGRYEARKELGLPIYYVIEPDAGIEDCRRMNTYNSAWNNDNFVNSYADSGNENYTRLIQAVKLTGWPYARVFRAVNKSKCDTAQAGILKTGKLRFTNEDMKKIEEIYKVTTEIKEAIDFSSRLNEAFYTAIVVMQSFPYDHKRFVKNCVRFRNRFQLFSRLEDQLKEFSQIYNDRARAADRLYFEDYMRNKGANVRDYDKKTIEEDISTLKKESPAC